MTDPVMTVDGHTFERKAIEEWFSKTKTGKPKNPMTNLELKSKNLYPNRTLKAAIEEFKNEIPAREKQQMEKESLEVCLRIMEEEMHSQQTLTCEVKKGV